VERDKKYDELPPSPFSPPPPPLSSLSLSLDQLACTVKKNRKTSILEKSFC
jgi:hypothetical protein